MIPVALNLAPTPPTPRSGAGAAGLAGETKTHKQLRKAAEEFESMLISQLLGDIGSSLSSMTGDASEAGASTLNSLAVQTLSSAMARRGGFGVAKMVVHQLEPKAAKSSYAPRRPG